ncbi:MAG TPA: LapA family protein [Dehalococcoidia bacterium]|nr:LapA family protein [Dehalococcoidia bacterium]
MLPILLLIAFAFALLISIFAVQNTRQVNVLLLTFEITGVPIAVLIIASAAVGATIAVLVSFAWQIRRGYAIWRERRQVRRRLQQLDAIERERDELRYQVEVLQAERAGDPPALAAGDRVVRPDGSSAPPG